MISYTSLSLVSVTVELLSFGGVMLPYFYIIHSFFFLESFSKLAHQYNVGRYGDKKGETFSALHTGM
jgi:hypothetical protein